MTPPVTCPGPIGITRRNMLQIGAIGALNLGLPQLLAARERQAGKKPTKADSCILLFLSGGPTHLAMWAMKPDEPHETITDFKPLATPMPGRHLFGHLPPPARLLHH